jgi:hypothetical protein
MVGTSHREADRSFWKTKRVDQRQQIEFSRRVGVRGGIVCALGMRDELSACSEQTLSSIRKKDEEV